MSTCSTLWSVRDTRTRCALPVAVSSTTARTRRTTGSPVEKQRTLSFGGSSRAKIGNRVVRPTRPASVIISRAVRISSADKRESGWCGPSKTHGGARFSSICAVISGSSYISGRGPLGAARSPPRVRGGDTCSGSKSNDVFDQRNQRLLCRLPLPGITGNDGNALVDRHRILDVRDLMTLDAVETV